nr:MAG TPA: hypothetical protein [Bacteriophage sp.]
MGRGIVSPILIQNLGYPFKEVILQNLIFMLNSLN